MANLNAWQKISRVLPGKDFGDGRDSTLTISADTTQSITTKTCSGTATSTTLTADTDASPFAVGDIVLIHQTRGTGVGQWEINKIDSVGSDQYTLSVALNYTYTDSGASQAQVVKIPMYTSVTVDSGKYWSAPNWAQDTGGLLVFACNGTVDGNGIFRLTGSDGSRSQPNPGWGSHTTGRGFRGSAGGSNAPTFTGYAAEGTTGDVTQSTSATGNGAGSSTITGSPQSAGGNGGGNGVAGSLGTTSGSPTQGAVGATAGSADLITFVLGGGGAGGVCNQTGGVGDGGSGAGGLFAFVKNIDLTGGSINANGGNGGGTSGDHGGGGGAGGSVLIVTETATLGTDLMTATGGTGFNGSGSDGGNGGVGRIAVHHSGSITGSSASPSFENVTDTSLSDMMIGYIHLLI